MNLLLTPGQAGDAPQAATLLRDTRPSYVVADAGYDSDALRELIQALGARPCIKGRRNRVRKKRCRKAVYKTRNVIERFFNSLKRFRRLATRYDKKAANYLGFVQFAVVLTQVK